MTRERLQKAIDELLQALQETHQAEPERPGGPPRGGSTPAAPGTAASKEEP